MQKMSKIKTENVDNPVIEQKLAQRFRSGLGTTQRINADSGKLTESEHISLYPLQK